MGSPAGLISAVNIDAINVPLDLGPAFAGATPAIDYALPLSTTGARYEAAVAFGQRLEPWLLSATKK